LYRQPTTRIDRIPEAACIQHIQGLNLSQHAIKLDAGYKVAAIFPQFVASATLEALKNDEEDPLEIHLEHDPLELGVNRLLKKHLHLIVEKPDTGESIACSISSAN
jgi:hypothetical protein